MATEMKMHQSTIHRVLTTLTNVGNVEQDVVIGRYKLIYKVGISSQLLDTLDVAQRSETPLQALAELTQEVVQIVVRDGGNVVYIEKVEGSKIIRMHSRVGTQATVHLTGVGKAILSYLQESNKREIIRQYGWTRTRRILLLR